MSAQVQNMMITISIYMMGGAIGSDESVISLFIEDMRKFEV